MSWTLILVGSEAWTPNPDDLKIGSYNVTTIKGIIQHARKVDVKKGNLVPFFEKQPYDSGKIKINSDFRRKSKNQDLFLKTINKFN